MASIIFEKPPSSPFQQKVIRKVENIDKENNVNTVSTWKTEVRKLEEEISEIKARISILEEVSMDHHVVQPQENFNLLEQIHPNPEETESAEDDSSEENEQMLSFMEQEATSELEAIERIRLHTEMAQINEYFESHMNSCSSADRAIKSKIEHLETTILGILKTHEEHRSRLEEQKNQIVSTDNNILNKLEQLENENKSIKQNFVEHKDSIESHLNDSKSAQHILGNRNERLECNILSLKSADDIFSNRLTHLENEVKLAIQTQDNHKDGFESYLSHLKSKDDDFSTRIECLENNIRLMANMQKRHKDMIEECLDKCEPLGDVLKNRIVELENKIKHYVETHHRQIEEILISVKSKRHDSSISSLSVIIVIMMGMILVLFYLIVSTMVKPTLYVS